MGAWVTFANNASKTALTGKKKNITTNAIAKTIKKRPILCQLMIFRLSPGMYKEEYEGLSEAVDNITVVVNGCYWAWTLYVSRIGNMKI